MSLDQLNSKKQLLILLVPVAILLGLYIQFRMLPELNNIEKLNKQLKADKALLKSPSVPEEPYEEIEDLEAKIARLDDEVQDLKVQVDSVEKGLPSGNSQDVILKISEIARQSGIRIVSNVPFPVMKRLNAKPAKGEGKRKKKLSAAQLKKQKKALRKAQKRARKLAKRNGGVAVVGSPTYEGELIDKLANDFENPRPLHAIKIEGRYHNVKSFIKALQEMPWQITVGQIDYRLSNKQVPKGYPRTLDVKMIVGM